ncbi:hypothetical protein U1Q18_021793 [Sarracenia purpurea var. burkii]
MMMKMKKKKKKIAINPLFRSPRHCRNPPPISPPSPLRTSDFTIKSIVSKPVDDSTKPKKSPAKPPAWPRNPTLNAHGKRMGRSCSRKRRESEGLTLDLDLQEDDRFLIVKIYPGIDGGETWFGFALFFL